MDAAVKIGLALGAVAAAAGVGYAVAQAGKGAASSPATPTPGVPPPGSTVWVRAATIAPGQSVRLSVASTAAADLPGFESLLASAVVQNALQSTNFHAWAPTDPLPADWPPDDTAASAEYHAQFVYGGAAPLLVSALPVALLAWVPKGTGAA